MTARPALRQAAEAVVGLSSEVRYVAIANGKDLVRLASPDRANASSGESDYYEERLINPTILELARRRGSEGCGGFDYLAIRYGYFHQLVIPSRRGHISVCVEPTSHVVDLVTGIRAATAALGTEPAFRAPDSAPTVLAAQPVMAWDDPVDRQGETIVTDLYRVSEEVRYVALNRGGRLVLSTRVGDFTGTDRSDRYEELLVNPSLVAMAKARGEIDCGGVRYLVVAYPSFFALVLPTPGGHATVSLPRSAAAIAIAPRFEAALRTS